MKKYLSQVAGVGLAATMTFAVQSSAQAFDFDFTSSDGGFTSSGSPDWTYTGSQWQTTNISSVNENFLTSPVLTSTVDGQIDLSLTHAYNFEDGFDGGIVEYSINGSPFSYFDSLNYNFTLSTGFSNPHPGIEAFSGTAAAVVSNGQAGTLTPGDTFQIRLNGGWDSSVEESNPAWEVSSISINASATPVPFGVSTDLSIIILGGLYGVSRLRKKLAVSK
ncbi:MAG: hypothetical protein ACFCAD_23805 [Pleurocapsa sp.]